MAYEPAINNMLNDYFTEKLLEYGPSHKSVDWNSQESQFLRFEQLSKLLKNDDHFTITDLGCGYGAYLEFLTSIGLNFKYYGIDLTQSMIDAAKKQYKPSENVNFICAEHCEQATDYIVSSGLFGVKNNISIKKWEKHVLRTLDDINAHATKGFAFNSLTTYSDKEKMEDRLYYADPCQLFHHCKTNYSRNVALLHDYGLYEFTIIVRK